MKLADWIAREGITRTEFARRIGVTGGTVTMLCNDEGYWLGRPVAEAIVRETRGEVTPNDFLGVGDPAVSVENTEASVSA